MHFHHHASCHSTCALASAAVGYQDPQSGQKYILIINQAICINGLDNHLLCPMQCCLNGGMHISDIPKFFAKSPSVTTHAIELADSFDVIHLLITLLQLSRVTSNFYVYSLSIAECENEDIPKIHLTADEPP